MIQATEAVEKRDIVADWGSNPDNARNWSTAKKLYNTAVRAVLCFLIYVENVSFCRRREAQLIQVCDLQLLYFCNLFRFARASPK